MFTSLKTSAPWKTKLMCVLKKGVLRITVQGFRTQLWLGEVSGHPMEHMPLLISEVLVSVLSNSLNHGGWPRVVSEDIHRHLEQLRSKVVTLRGRAEGRTLLPLPLCVERSQPQDILLSSNGWPIDRALLYSIETLVIQWSGQVWTVLKRDSSMVLQQGDHPGPSAELHFWACQRGNLLGIHSQIMNPKVEQIMEILRRIKSSYYASFHDICLKVNQAVSEAEDIDLYLRPLRRLISCLEEGSFNKLEMLLPPLFHTLCLIWSRSQYYCRPPRMVLLLQEFCNLLIEKAFAYLIPEELFKMELEEGVERVQVTIGVLRSFKRLFHTHRQRIPQYYRSGETVRQWDFPSTLVFHRADHILDRLLMIEELFASALVFLKLEKVELGGSRGKILSEMVFSMNEEFHDSWRTLRESKHDPLDYTKKVKLDFLVDYRRFMEQNRDFDQRLGTVLNLAFQHSKGLESAFKLLQIFGTLLERPRINQLFSPNYSTLLGMFNTEIDHCQIILDQQRERLRSGCVVLSKNMPPVAGNLKWSQELRDRILTNRSNLNHLIRMPLGSAEAEQVLQKCERVLEVLDQHDEELFSVWTEGLEELCNTHLQEPLLTLDQETGLFQVNFSPALTSVLREVKYLSMLKNHSIPKAALHLYSKRETLYMYTQTLALITQWYNRLHSTILAVELGLVKEEMGGTRRQLKPALQELTWSRDDLLDYVQATRDLVQDVSSRVQSSKANVEAIQALMGKFSHQAFITRKTRGSTLLILTDMEESISKQYTLITNTGEQIHTLLKENLALLGVSAPDCAEWRSYTDYVDRMVLAGFSSAVRCSLQYLIENTDPALRIAPLFEVQLVLDANEMTFEPSLDISHQGNFYDIIDKMVGDITKMASFIPRVAKHKQMDNYQSDIDRMADLSELGQVIRGRARSTISKVREYQVSFSSYRYLWTDDRSEFMRQFLLYGHVLSTEEAELYADYELAKNPPTLDNFKEQISLFESLYVRVSKLEDRRVFCGWLQLDIKPFKLALMNIIKRWSWMFKEHLLNHVNQSVSDLTLFVQNTSCGLSNKVSDGDYAGLVDIMGHLMAIRDRQISADQHFKPLKSTTDLLKTYGQQLPGSVYTQLEELPEKWKSLKKVAFTVKHEVAPLQSNEVSVIRRKCVRFEIKQHEFREQFRSEVIFRIDVEEPYKLIDKSNRVVAVLEAEMCKLQDTADLFEVSFPDYKQLRQCRSDIILVKAVWDMVIFVKTSIEDWTKTPWKEINVEQMDMELRRFAKEMKTLDKEVHVWDVYLGLESTVKNLLTSLRAVNELQNPAVRERHWQQLMNTTGVRFVMWEGTTLGDLLELQLHRVEDEVKNIVDKAVKEMAIEKVLAEITQTWSVMALSYEKHPSIETPLLKSDENLIETLEDNQVQLQNILMSKYVEYFQAEVSGWQRRLMVADLVISAWMSVQRTWAHLNSIFTNSHDIRSQLARDAERFQGIHSDFQNMMTEVVQTRNVVEVTNQPGFLEKLEALQQRLSVCEKALAEYLETKRLTFPRFYFVSATDLLEIVSKGTQPKQVTRHLLKLFDNVADLRFQDSEKEGEEGEKKRGEEDEGEAVAIGMYSREGEYVPFSEPCICQGQAECWLSELERTMRSTVQREIQEAVAAYEDKPRDQWLFDYPAQVGLTGSQVWWATDVGIAFERVEEGFETALKDYNRKQITQLNSLIHMLLGDLTPGDRQKIMTLCTIDVHARDVVAKLIAQKVTTGQAFAWLSQLRHRWDDVTRHCYINICDAQFQFSYEYLGNTNRLVITPLTDRCYITLTQSLHLTMSGAPSGPAGTGKTETTKDLGRSLGIMVYVFNCSEQMDYKSIGNIYKGLAQTGVWGCFDEFNRISVEVLSVVAVQVKTIQDAIRNKRQRFHFLGEEIELRPTVGIFITLNPGYAGRTELPENLKALFRPCAMVIPDYELICEIMLVAEGFIDARLLARKFISLYTLCKELLSKQDHYDWGLRAIKSVLVVAGSLKREDRSRPEEQVFCEVEVKKLCLSQANADLAEAADKLEAIRKKLAELDCSLDTLTAAFEKATSEKLRCQDEVNHTNKTIELANRLVKGLESENVRWAHSVAGYHEQEETLCGDLLLTAAFISYAGSFSKKYRRELLENLWMPFLRGQKIPIPMTEGLDPVCMLTDDATVAQWNNEGLPGDKMSTQNATILTNCERWPLLIDPQLQGIKWIKIRYGNSLKVVSLGEKGYVDVIEQAVVTGDTVLIENLEESIDPVIDPLLGRHTIKKGSCIKVGDKECFFHPAFRLILHTKLANPHYKPEIQAQTTLINFTVTRDGLEDQLLAQVVNLERPDLEHLKSDLTKQQNLFKIELKLLEDELLGRLSAAESNFLGDNVLVEKLETTKHTAAEIEMKVLEAKVNEVKINEAREHYRPVAVRSSLLYFIMNDLNKINPMYQFSLKAFNVVFHKAVEQAEVCEDVRSRVNTLIDGITYSTFNYISRGLFERDKLTFTAQLAFQLLLMSKEIDVRELDFLLRFNIDHSYICPVDFLSNQAWSAIKTMSFTDEFRGLDRDIEGSPKRWKKVVESECPEKEKFPQEWKAKSSLQKLIMMRALRPDRMTYAVRNFVEEKLGVKYTERRKTEFAKSFRESGPASPVFFILSPGVDPLKDVESLGRKLGFTIDLGKLHNVSLGQGQEAVAEVAMEMAAKEGHWVILQNIHLVARWLGSLEKLLERCCEGSHQDYRVFMSAEPAPTPQEHIIPQGILENAIKITNEPPTGMHANLHAALDNFDQDILDQCSREQEFKTILFSLCYFHACVAERRKFGPQGWNRKYPFNTGDLTISVNVLYNYLEANSQVPWEDLRYLFGEIMYGGHITDDWDRRLCRTYLEEYMQPNQSDRKLALAPGFVVPSNLDYQGYHGYIDEMLPHESPVHYGLHPNAEIEFLTVTSDNLFHTLLELQSPDSVMGEGASQTVEEKVKTILDEVLEKLPEEYNMSDITSKTAERSPYILVCFQECERMNTLIYEIRRSLKELDLGLKGELAISSEMEQIQAALFFDNVPDTWTKLAYPSTYSLAQWYNDVLLRCRELDSWTQDLALPTVIWLSGLFNPQSFLTAVMQSLARKNEWPLDKMNLTVDVTKKFKEEFNQPAREGVYVYGLYMEGARWDTQGGVIAEARLKELTPSMPVISVRAVPNDRQETRNIYECPLYKTKLRGTTYVWTFSLKTRERPAKWVLAGVALLLSV
uniref:dynein axonemal heavy chain 11 n=1 Tax=Oncorhynchus gorbuscha TaxID=8017 RepID=UPI001EAF67CE|nr:dynein axonemal heavy chain 11 [Oncorhynchus gorbuscha]